MTSLLAILSIAVVALIWAGFSAWSEHRILTTIGADFYEPDFDEHTEQALAMVNQLPAAPPQVFDPFVRSLPLSEAIYLLPDALADEVEAWLAGEAS